MTWRWMLWACVAGSVGCGGATEIDPAGTDASGDPATETTILGSVCQEATDYVESCGVPVATLDPEVVPIGYCAAGTPVACQAQCTLDTACSGFLGKDPYEAEFFSECVSDCVEDL